MLPVGAMFTAPLAVLHSGCGDLHIFDGDALAKLAKSLPSHSMEIGSMAKEPSPFVSLPNLHDGFTIEQWASYGRQKAKIASTICKENGLLKRRLAEKMRAEDNVDMLFQNDPWQATMIARSRDTETVASDPCADLWASWVPSKISHRGDMWPCELNALIPILRPHGQHTEDVVEEVHNVVTNRHSDGEDLIEDDKQSQVVNMIVDGKLSRVDKVKNCGDQNKPGDKNEPGDIHAPGDMNELGDKNEPGHMHEFCDKNELGDKNEPGDKNELGDKSEPGDMNGPGDKNEPGDEDKNKVNDIEQKRIENVIAKAHLLHFGDCPLHCGECGCLQRLKNC